MEWTMDPEFLHTVDGTIFWLLSSLFTLSDFRWVSFVEGRLLAIYRTCQLKIIKLHMTFAQRLQGGCMTEGQYKARADYDYVG